MATKRITMRKIREVLRLHFAAQLSVRKISASTKISVGGIQKLLTKARALSLSWPLPDEILGLLVSSILAPTLGHPSDLKCQIGQPFEKN